MTVYMRILIEYPWEMDAPWGTQKMNKQNEAANVAFVYFPINPWLRAGNRTAIFNSPTYITIGLSECDTCFNQFPWKDVTRKKMCFVRLLLPLAVFLQSFAPIHDLTLQHLVQFNNFRKPTIDSIQPPKLAVEVGDEHWAVDRFQYCFEFSP